MSGCGMSEKPETTEDIIAEMNRVDICADGEPCLRDYADRLEAAHKREVDALNEQIADLRQQRDLWSKRSAELVERCNEHYAKIKQVGDCAKLREAAEKTRATLEEALQILNGISDEEAGTLNARLEDVADEICEVTQWIIPDALAAPPRNCDVHTADELKAIFKSELVSELPIANEHEKNLVTITANGVIDTLYAPATEKEGGVK